MAQSLEQDSWSLESSQGWVMQVGQEPSPGQHNTKATLVSALDFVSCLVGQGHQRGETQGSVPAHTSLPPTSAKSIPVPPPSSSWGGFSQTLPLAGTSHPAPCGTAIPVPALAVCAAVLS